MPIVFVVPIRSFHLGKSRLAGVLEPAERDSLARRLASHVVTTVQAAGFDTAVITADQEVARWAGGHRSAVVSDPNRGLSVAANASVAWADQNGHDWIILHADLPTLDSDDVVALVNGLQAKGSVLAPSSDGGTSAIGADRPLDFSYGPASFHRHLAQLGDTSVVARPGLLLDVDSDHDLRAANLVRSAP
ncbi:MAG TPA: 2-phospho-L-lactate guanylyltransferase [Acidimicrobiia bacterium]|nr:2-phospho-L-lactate guanylyltransferase [Acidimicrobiia bacterium]